MKNFEYAQPRSEEEAVALLNEPGKKSVVLAGGTDVVGLMKRMIVNPDRVVYIGEIATLKSIVRDAEKNTWVGTGVSLDDFLSHKHTQLCAAAKQVIQGISSIQLQSQGTLGGELLRRPTCWYFRNGHGILAEGGKRVVEGDNRYHAILGNRGPAKFTSASRLAPVLISMGASLRIVGPEANAEQYIDVADLYRTPESDQESEFTLRPGQLVTHVIIPPDAGRLTAAYEVRQGEGPDQPLAAAAVELDIQFGRVQDATIVLGQVAPTPWIAQQAALSLVGKAINEEVAGIAGFEAVAGARALSMNEYKIQLARVAVKRALLRAVGLETGGLDRPVCSAADKNPTEESQLV